MQVNIPKRAFNAVYLPLLMEGPSPDIIKLIREEIDPGQAFIKVPKD